MEGDDESCPPSPLRFDSSADNMRSATEDGGGTERTHASGTYDDIPPDKAANAIHGEQGHINGQPSTSRRTSSADYECLKRPHRRMQHAARLAMCVQRISPTMSIGEDFRVNMGDFKREMTTDEEKMIDDFKSHPVSDPEVDSEDEIALPEQHGRAPRNIAILIVGTRGDVQPFVAIGRRLKEFGHRVRLASHINYREFVTSAGLEFYPLGGDPKILAEYMVKNKGFLPGSRMEVTQQRIQLRAIINSLWPACTEEDKESNGAPFTAHAIIANPPCIAHVHVAEKMKVPLHVFFTMPWTPTKAYPHPLARTVTFTGFDNWISYAIVENLLWMGCIDIINDFKKRTLNLKSTTPVSGHTLPTAVIPFGYIWSPSLVPKPADWGKKIDVCGFCFLNQGREYKPPSELEAWLKNGTPPIFIGFGSLPVGQPEKMTEIIVSSLQETGQRGIIQKGWGGLGDMKDPPPSVYTLGDCPHDWLFPKCLAVVHHGGAGTTAAGLRAGKPTTVVPFFGDQPFWGARVHASGVGPEPISSSHFSKNRLVAAIRFMLEAKTMEAAEALAEKISHEDGVEGAVRAFHKHLPELQVNDSEGLPCLKPSKLRQFRGKVRSWLTDSLEEAGGIISLKSVSDPQSH